MTMPTDIGAIDLMIGFPMADAAKTYDYLRPTMLARRRATRGVPGRVHVQGRPEPPRRRGDRPRRDHARRDGPAAASTSGWSASASEVTQRALQDHPDRFVGSLEVDPNDITGTVRKIRAAKDEHDIKAVTTFPAGLQPAGAGRRPSLLPDLPDVHRPRHPDRRQRRHRRAAGPVGVPGRHALRPGLLRLPRAADRDASRRRAVGGAGRQAHAEVAGPLLHDVCVRPEVLPEGDHRLRQHARRRQDHVRRLLPDGPQPANASSPSCRTCRSATTCGRSSCARTPCRVFKLDGAAREPDAPHRLRGQRPRRARDRRRASRCCAAARRRCASARTSGRSSRASPSCSASGAASCATRARRRSTSRSSSSASQPGDEVITSAVTFSTDIAPLVRAGLVPAFVDVEPDTYNIDVDGIEAMIGPAHPGHPRRRT